MHDAVRFAVIATDGPVVVFEFSEGEFLDAHSEVVDAVRPAPSYTHFLAGPRAGEIIGRWAAEIASLVTEHGRSGHGRAGARLAVDRLDLAAARALESHGIELAAAEPLMETARTVKSVDEIRAMRCAVHVGELMGFDTDLVGAYGICVDMSRTWLCGDGRPTAAQHDTWALAAEQIERNIELHQAGMTLREITDKAWYPDPDQYRHYTSISHGVGLCDEYPAVGHRHKWDKSGYDGVLEPGMVMCVETFVGHRSGGEGVKLEQQVLMTETGNEVLTHLPLGLV